MATLKIKSPVKVIKNGTVPTASTLKKGEWAYGVIGGKNRYFGNPTGSAVVEFTPDDAPADGKLYARKNGQWVEIAAASEQVTASSPTQATAWTNVQKSGQFTRNNCGSGYAGSTVVYTVPGGTYSSTVSQADADAKALADIAASGQAYANAHGTCTLTAKEQPTPTQEQPTPTPTEEQPTATQAPTATQMPTSTQAPTPTQASTSPTPTQGPTPT